MGPKLDFQYKSHKILRNKNELLPVEDLTTFLTVLEQLIKYIGSKKIIQMNCTDFQLSHRLNFNNSTHFKFFFFVTFYNLKTVQ